MFLFGPWIIDHLRLRQGKGQPIRADGPPSHLLTKAGTPTMGGLMILSGVTVSTVLWANPTNPYVWIVLGVTLAFGLIGFYDDYLKVTKQTHAGISGVTRLAFEARHRRSRHASRSPASGGRRSPPRWRFRSSRKRSSISAGFIVVFGAFIIVGAGNAVNLTDGLDGLAIVPVMMAAGCFGRSPMWSATRSIPTTCSSTT